MRINVGSRKGASRPEGALLVLATLVSLGLSTPSTVAAPPDRGTPLQLVSGVVSGRAVDGLELIRASNRRIVLDRNGWLHDFDPLRTEHSLQGREGRFEPLEAMQMRARLAAEFGREFEVVATTHFLVVTPVARGAHWAQTFERLHRTFTTFFSLRGVRVLNGNFPMVAIVMPDRGSMQNYLATLGIRAPEALGVYDRASNRIVMYDHGGSHGGVATTICHEAAHQSAFNTGVHSRVVDTPHWIVEGVGGLFQSPALVEGRPGATRRDRCDPGLLATFEETYAGRTDALVRDVESLIGGDRMFSNRETVRAAYTLSWALTFYLVEAHGEALADLLNAYGRRPPLEPYAAVSRIRDFEQILGDDIATASHQLSRFFERL